MLMHCSFLEIIVNSLLVSLEITRLNGRGQCMPNVSDYYSDLHIMGISVSLSVIVLKLKPKLYLMGCITGMLQNNAYSLSK